MTDGNVSGHQSGMLCIAVMLAVMRLGTGARTVMVAITGSPTITGPRATIWIIARSAGTGTAGTATTGASTCGLTRAFGGTFVMFAIFLVFVRLGLYAAGLLLTAMSILGTFASLGMWLCHVRPPWVTTAWYRLCTPK
jgi:hypothetical protein